MTKIEGFHFGMDLIREGQGEGIKFDGPWMIPEHYVNWGAIKELLLSEDLERVKELPERATLLD